MTYSTKLTYAGSDPFEPERDRLPYRIVEQLEQDETYQRLAEVRWLVDELEIELTDADDIPKPTMDALFDAVATGDDAPLQRAVDTYVAAWLRDHREEFDDADVEAALQEATADA